jgi:hypothetical protein
VSLPDQVLNGVSVFFAPFYPANVGHTILDTIYPVFLSLLKLDLGNASYHSFITSSRWADRWLRPIQSVFAGGELFFMNLAVPNMTIRKLVVGCGGFGSRTVQNNVIALDRGLDSFRRFRDRMFRRFGIIPRASFQQSIFHGIIVNNKRFSRLDRLNFLRFCKDISGRTLSFRWIDLASIPSYRSQLEIFSQSDIYISATGTGINHNIFLPDHSVVVNLGTPSLPYEFFENDRVIACCDWVRVLYYPSNASLAAYDIHIIAHLVTQSLSFLKNPRWYPVPAFESLSPVSRAFLTYCRNGSLACADFMRDTFDLRTACGESSYVGRFLFDGPGTKCRTSLEHAAPHCRFLRFDQIVCAD